METYKGGKDVNIKYKLLGNYTGLVLTRIPEVTNELTVIFEGAPKDATAIFSVKGGGTFYRDLEDGTCCIPTKNLVGEITVTVVHFDGGTHPPKWNCDELMGALQRDGSVLISPNDTILSEEVIHLRLENQELRETLNKLMERMNEFDEWRVRLMEGYDIT